MIKGDCFTPKYEDFELEEENKPEEINNEDEGETGTYEKNKVDQSTTDLWEFRTTIKEIFVTWSPTILIKSERKSTYINVFDLSKSIPVF